MGSRVRSPALPQILNVDYVWNGVHPSLVRTIGLLLDGEVADLIKKVDINRLDGA